MLKNEKLGLIEESEENKTLIIKSKIRTFRGIMLEYIEKLIEKYGQDPWNEDVGNALDISADDLPF